MRVVAAGLLLLSACTADVGAHREAVVYGADDRRDLFEQPDPTLQSLTRRSIVALMTPDTLDVSNPDDVRFDAPTLGQSYNLCPGERYATQPTAAFCSGTLIDHDLVITAGHCVEDMAGCANTRFVFGYYYESAGQLARVTSNDVYSCARIVTRQYDGRVPDYAVIQLDRSVDAARAPAPVADTPIAVGAPVSIIGFGIGLPAKLDGGGRVISAGATSFEATVDAYGGNSGSGLFDREGRLVGVLSGGNEDFVDRGGCTASNVLADSASSGEIMTHAGLAVQALCGAGHESGLCGSAPVCGDGACDAGERCASDCDGAMASVCGDGMCDAGERCASDCGGGVCGDGACDAGESAASCASDCGAVGPPAGWMCPASSYGAGDGCDCDCGAPDPDCAFAPADVHGCAEGILCGGDGSCMTEPTREGTDRTLVGACAFAPGRATRASGVALGLLWLLFARRRRR